MKEPEFTLASDKRTWMDTSVISDFPVKLTIIDPHPFVYGITAALESLPCIERAGFSKTAFEHLVKSIVQACMSGIVNRRRAWVHGHDTDYQIHLMNLRELIGFDVDAELREEIREDLGDKANNQSADRLDKTLQEMVDLLKQRMNPNQFVLHRLTQSRDLRTFNLEEYADWRVIQWTKAEQDRIASRHETI